VAAAIFGEPIGAQDLAAWRQAIHDEVRTATYALAQRNIEVDALALLARADGIEALTGALKTRHHGDYHLGQVLERDDGSFAINRFRGRTVQTLNQRREKRSPLRDVAGLLRSFDYARNAAVRAGDSSDARRIRRADEWYHAAREACLDTYQRAIHRHRRICSPANIARGSRRSSSKRRPTKFYTS